MEEILSSIKRIIAEEGDQPARRGRPARLVSAVPPSLAEADDEVLELSEPLPAPRPEAAEPAETRAAPAPRPAQETRAMPEPRLAPERRAPEPSEPPEPPEPIVSSEAAAASRGALEALSRMLVKPEPGTDGTLEGLVREMIRPMLREWLDANLPEIVQTLVAREIKRITAAAS